MTAHEIIEALDKTWFTIAMQSHWEQCSPACLHEWNSNSNPKMAWTCAKDSWSKRPCQQRKPCPQGFCPRQLPKTADARNRQGVPFFTLTKALSYSKGNKATFRSTITQEILGHYTALLVSDTYNGNPSKKRHLPQISWHTSRIPLHLLELSPIQELHRVFCAKNPKVIQILQL